MATEEQHLSQYEHNTSIAERLTASSDYDWAVVILFYASLHLVMAYLTRSGLTPRTHTERDRQMLSRAELAGVLSPYRTLRNHSEHARYECRRFSLEEFQAIRRELYDPVVAHVYVLLEVQ